MTATSLISAVTVGLVLGFLARRFVRACHALPFWLPMAVGVGAAVLGTVTARLAGVDTSQVSPVEVVIQVALAGSGIGVVAATADRRPPADRYGRSGASQ